MLLFFRNDGVKVPTHRKLLHKKHLMTQGTMATARSGAYLLRFFAGGQHSYPCSNLHNHPCVARAVRPACRRPCCWCGEASRTPATCLCGIFMRASICSSAMNPCRGNLPEQASPGHISVFRERLCHQHTRVFLTGVHSRVTHRLRFCRIHSILSAAMHCPSFS